MLNLYQSRLTIPKDMLIVDDNRDFFVRNTILKLDEQVNGLLKQTDGAIYLNKQYFTDKHGITVPWFCMSTGGMTILNVYYNPDICFNLIECGDNARFDLFNVTNGNAFPFMVYNYSGDMKCKVRIDGRTDSEYLTVKELFE